MDSQAGSSRRSRTRSRNEFNDQEIGVGTRACQWLGPATYRRSRPAVHRGRRLQHPPHRDPAWQNRMSHCGPPPYMHGTVSVNFHEPCWSEFLLVAGPKKALLALGAGFDVCPAGGRDSVTTFQKPYAPSMSRMDRYGSRRMPVLGIPAGRDLQKRPTTMLSLSRTMRNKKSCMPNTWMLQVRRKNTWP